MDIKTVEWIFWICFGVLAYTWLGYPMLLFILERALFRPIKKSDIEPTVSILVLAHNEEDRIGRKIENLLALDYPKHLLEIVVASDGSYDRTAQIARKYADRGVKLAEFPTRRGKPSVLNEVVPNLTGKIVLLVDTRQRLEPDTLKKIVANFADESIGGVSGELMFEDSECAGIASGMNTYWHYEKWIRIKEAGFDSTIGGTGAIFALRKDCFRPIPGEAILDDVVLPLQIVRENRRVVLEAGARAWDQIQTSWPREFARKTRTLSGNFQILFNILSMGPGLRLLGPIGFCFFSHKVTRLLGPLCLAGMFAGCRYLQAAAAPGSTEHSLYSGLYYAQLAFYGLAVLGGMLHGRKIRLPGISLAYSFVIMQAAVVTGFLRFCSGRDDVLWEKAHSLDPATTWQRVMRLVFDSSLFTISFILAFYIRYLGSPPKGALESYMALFPYWEIFGVRLAVPIVMLIPVSLFYLFRVNETRTHEVNPEYALTLIKSVFFSTLALFVVVFIYRASMLKPDVSGDAVISFPTSVFLIGFLVACALIGGWRILLIYLRHSVDGESTDNRDLLLMYGDERNSEASLALENGFRHPAKVIALLNTQPATAESPNALKTALEETRPNQMIIAPQNLTREQVLEAVSIGEDWHIPIRLLPGDLEILLGNIRPRLTSYIPLLDISCDSDSDLLICVRNAINLSAGLVAMLAGAPFLCTLLLAGLISGGKRKRARIGWVRLIGRHGRLFKLPRLRFTKGWPALLVCPARWCLAGFALFTRRISLTGPRYFLPGRFEKLPQIARRHLRYRPGLFSLDEIAICRNEKLDRYTAALVYYARNNNPALDLQIMLNAFRKSRLKKQRSF